MSLVPHCRLTADPLDPRQAEEAVRGPDRGALATFHGIVRDHHAGRRVVRIEYHAYVPMAEAVLQEIAGEAAGRFGTPHIAIHHRTGNLSVGDISLLVAVSAVHRKEALAACSWIVDRVKERAPIWKKEFGEGGAFWIEGPGECVPEASLRGPEAG
jgi:molybdopterin synthase catalytic subunit